MIRGFVDVIRRDLITGWVADSDDPNRVFEIVVHVDGLERGRYFADQPRQDLRAAGIYGEGNHSFRIVLDPPLCPEKDHEVIVCPLAGGGAAQARTFPDGQELGRRSRRHRSGRRA